MLLGFTTDREQVRLALQTLGVLEPVGAIFDPLGLTVAQFERDDYLQGVSGGPEPGSTPVQVALPGGGVVGISPRAGATPRDLARSAMVDALRDLDEMAKYVVREQRQRQVQDFAASLDDLGSLLSSVDGRKHVVFFSEGFDTDVVTGTDDRERVEEITRAAELGELWKVDSDERFGNRASQQELRLALQAMQRADGVIHSVDIAGLRGAEAGGGRPGQQDGLVLLATETGGEFLRNYNDLTEAMDELFRRTALTYLLVVQPEDVAPDGAWHPLEVRLARDKSLRGARVSHRSGYFADRSFRELSAEERKLVNAQSLLEGEEGGAIGMDLLATPLREPGRDAFVLTVAEVDGPTLVAGQRSGELPLEIYAYALDEQGRVHDLLSQAVRLDVEGLGPQLTHKGFRFVGHLRLRSGVFTIRFLLRNVLTGETALRKAEVEVPDYLGGEAAVSPPLFIEPPGQWLEVWEDRIDADDRYPLETRQGKIVPTVRPILLAQRRTSVLLVLHGLGDELEARATLHGGDRQPVPIELRLEKRFETRLAEVDRVAVALLPGDVEPGEYLLEVVVTDAESGSVARATLPVRVPKSFGS